MIAKNSNSRRVRSGPKNLAGALNECMRNIRWAEAALFQGVEMGADLLDSLPVRAGV